jgi:cellobionic acid phosphorylase
VEDERLAMSAFPNRWSRLIDAGHCLEISDLFTPLNWDNHLYAADGKFYAEISQRGLGPVYYNYEANRVSAGRNFCLGHAGEVWSLTGGPSPQTAQSRTCRQYPGRSVFLTSNRGIAAELLVALDPDDCVEIERLTLTNETKRELDVVLTAVQLVELEGLDNTQQLEESRYDPALHALLLQRRHATTANNKYAAFFTADAAPDSFCGSWQDFMGGDGDWAQAIAWRTDRLPQAHAYATKPVFALRFKLTLPPGATRTLLFGFGLADDFEDAARRAAAFRSPGHAERALARNAEFYAGALGSDRIVTPDKNLDLMLNVWTRLQLFHQNLSARKGPLHNWRNNLQDAMGWLIFEPARARQRIREMCEQARVDGFLPRSSPKGSHVPAMSHHSLTQRHADIATWAAWCAARFAQETGDLAFFEEEAVCAGGEKSGAVADILAGGLLWLTKHRGRNGLVLMLDGDWSDPLEAAGRKGIGESPWTSVALVHAIRHFAPILRRLNRNAMADVLDQAARELTGAVNTAAWDGEWYIRGITDGGIRFCTRTDPDANVSLMMQAWAVIAGVVPPDRLEPLTRALDSHCKTDIGPVLYGPPFLRERPEIGRESAKRPGTGENGSCYTHAAVMLAWAEIQLNRPDEALRILQQVLPLAREDVYDVRRGSPLWWANYYQSPHANHPGRSSNIISSGAPAWLFMVVYEGLLGITPSLDGLRITPRLPTTWNQIRVTRLWRGARYEFEYRREPGCTANRVLLDGHPLPEPMLPIPRRPGIHKVEVTA